MAQERDIESLGDTKNSVTDKRTRYEDGYRKGEQATCLYCPLLGGEVAQAILLTYYGEFV